MAKQIQIDVTSVNEKLNVAFCNLYTGDRCVKIIMGKHNYELLINDGFFIRDGITPDSANVLNTTLEYTPKK